MITRKGFLRASVYGTLGLAIGLGAPKLGFAANKTLKIGVLGVMSGPAASWGLVNRYCAEARANMINAAGGLDIGGEKYDLEIISVDDRNDPKVAVSGAERLIYEEGVHYIIGPNIDTTAAAVVPVVEEGGAMNIPYAFSRELYSPPRENSILGMIASYQAGPVIYGYLKDNEGVERVAFISRNESDSLNQRAEGVEAAKELGLEVVAAEATYAPGTTDFFPVLAPILSENPDLVVLSGVAPSDAPLLIKSARELGYQGLLSTETAQDAKILSQVAGEAANGFISVGGASTPKIRSDFMEEFAGVYEEVAGEWNDEAGTKVYALEMILETLKHAGPEAVDDIGVFKAAMNDVDEPNPFVKEGEPRLKFVGEKYFEQNRQLNVPMVVNVYRDGGFETLFIGSVE